MVENSSFYAPIREIAFSEASLNCLLSSVACSAVEQILIPEASVEGGNHQNASKTLEIHLETSIVTLGWIQTAHRAPQPDIATVTLFG